MAEPRSRCRNCGLPRATDVDLDRPTDPGRDAGICWADDEDDCIEEGDVWDLVAKLRAEVDRLKPAADAMAWLEANRPHVVTLTRDGGALVMTRGTLKVHTGTTLTEAAGKAMGAGKSNT